MRGAIATFARANAQVALATVLNWLNRRLFFNSVFRIFLQLPIHFTKNQRPKSKFYRDALLSLAFFYHPEKNRDSKPPFVAGVWA